MRNEHRHIQVDTAEAARIVAWRKTTEEGAAGEEGKGGAKLGASQPPPQLLTAAVLRLHAPPMPVRAPLSPTCFFSVWHPVSMLPACTPLLSTKFLAQGRTQEAHISFAHICSEALRGQLHQWL